LVQILTQLERLEGLKRPFLEKAADYPKEKRDAFFETETKDLSVEQRELKRKIGKNYIKITLILLQLGVRDKETRYAARCPSTKE